MVVITGFDEHQQSSNHLTKVQQNNNYKAHRQRIN